jgi:uncharacterized phage protein (TIGR02218 family)
MRSISTQLQTEIDNGTIANCILITRQDGVKYAFTDCEVALTVSGQTYTPAPGLQRLRLTTTANAEVSNQEFGSAWVDVPESDLRGGKFDNCTVEVAWVSWKNPSYGKVIVFTGGLGDIVWTDEGFKADVVSFMKNLELILGNSYTAQCRHQLFSQAKTGVIGFCGVVNTGYSFTGSITSVITPKWKFGISSVKADKYYANGQITFTSGLNNGLSAVVKIHSNNEIELFLPTGFVVNVGDTFVIKAGCDKTRATCKNKFNNVINFGGFPHIKPDVQFR